MRKAVRWRQSHVTVSVSVPLLFQTVGNSCENGDSHVTVSVSVGVPLLFQTVGNRCVRMAVQWRGGPVSVNVTTPG